MRYSGSRMIGSLKKWARWMPRRPRRKSLQDEEFMKNLALDPPMMAQTQCFMALEEANWRKKDVKRKAPKGKREDRVTQETRKGKFIPLLTPCAVILVQGEKC